MSVCALLAAGSNARGQLATGDMKDSHDFSSCYFVDSVPGVLPHTACSIVRIACGSNHTLVLLDMGETSGYELRGCGDGTKGQLGIQAQSNAQSNPSAALLHKLDLNLHRLALQEYNARDVAACWETSYVVLSCPGRSDILLSMGADDFGDLGVGNKGKGTESAGPVHIVDLRGAISPNQEESFTLSIPDIDTGSHHIIVRIMLTYRDGSTHEHVVGWGTSRHGQLGTHNDSKTGRPIPFLGSPRLVFPLPTDASIISSASGTHHTVLLHSSGRLSALGSNRKGQLDGVNILEDVSAIDCTWNGTYAVVRQGAAWSVLSAGNHNKGQLGRPLTATHHNPHGHPPMAVHFPFSHETHSIVKMACGSEHILCLLTLMDGGHQSTEVWGWGWNEHGNLGLGYIQDQDTPVLIWPPSPDDPRKAIDIWAGYGTSWILVES